MKSSIALILLTSLFLAGCASEPPAGWRTSSLAAFGPPARVKEWEDQSAPQLEVVLLPDQTLTVGMDPGSTGMKNVGGVEREVRAIELRVGDVECDPTMVEGGDEFWQNSGGRGGGNYCVIPLVKVPVEGGPTSVSCRAKMQIFEFGDKAGDDHPILISRFQKQIRTNVNLPPGRLPVRIVHNVKLSEELESSIHISPLEWRINDPAHRVSEYKLNCTIDGPIAPANLGYDVWMVTGKQSWPKLGTVACAKGSKIHAEIELKRMLGWPLGSVNIVLRPSVETAAKAGLSEILGDEIIVKHDAHPTPIGPQE